VRLSNQRRGLCSKHAIVQQKSTCYVVATLLLLSKIDALYYRLDKLSQAFVDSVKILDAQTCSRIPKHVWEIYLRKIGKLADPMAPGKTLNLLESFLDANAVTYFLKQFKIQSKTFNTKRLCNGLNLALSRKPGISIIKLHLDIKKTPAWAVNVLHAIKTCHSRFSLRGGYFQCERAMPHKIQKHAVPFTICDGKVLSCNGGRCMTSTALFGTLWRVTKLCMIFESAAGG